MAYQRYQGYQYETSPRKLQPEYESTKSPYDKKKASTLKKQKNNQDNKKQMKPKARMLIGVAIMFAVLLAISYQNSLITENFNQKERLKKNLNTIEKENEQLKINIEKSLNLNKVEQSAKEMLGMQKLDNTQKRYIALPKQDYVESDVEEVIIEEEKTFWEQITEGISKIFK